MISFCYEDITRLEVEAIVNSANSALEPSRNPYTLNSIIHKAAGPDLIAEAKSKGKLKPGQAELTHGYNLPSAWIIHAVRPRYSPTNGMGQLNILTECYRSVLKVAVNYEFKTLAFPCLGTGGCGFPPRLAARVALQEVREYLDEHKKHKLDRIIFCVKTAVDEKAYMDFFPAFFPPTHGDLDVARISGISANRAALTDQVLETRTQVQNTRSALYSEIASNIKDFDSRILVSLQSIDATLASIRSFLISAQELKRSLGDLSLVCAVLQIACGNVMETTELAKDIDGSGQTHEHIWTEHNTLQQDKYGMNSAEFFAACEIFVRRLDDIVNRDETESTAMSIIRQQLESYGAQQKGQDSKGIRDHLDEILYTREFTREAVHQAREKVRLYQIRSLSQLYHSGELEAKPTLARPSAIFNHTVCLIREDITKLEVDVLVNSTDKLFQGLGTLDRSVFKKGGFQLNEDIKKFGECKEGDIKITPGYLLPAKHIVHIIPPSEFRKTTKDILRQIYRGVLHTAMSLKATSIAIPCIGTGMLNFPRRESACLGMEEIKRFLESTLPSNLIEKIVLVVYSSNDEFIYRSLLPIYFPPPVSLSS